MLWELFSFVGSVETKCCADFVWLLVLWKQNVVPSFLCDFVKSTIGLIWCYRLRLVEGQAEKKPAHPWKRNVLE